MGGKKALRSIIYRLFPKSYGRYIEVFGGGGWVLFGKPPECKGGKEVYNDYNGNLANLFYCVKNRTLAFLKELGFLPLNSRDEFSVLRRFFEKGEFDTEYLKEELELAQHNLSPPDFAEIEAILMQRAEPSDVWRAAAFFKLIRYSYGSGCTSYGCQSFDIRKNRLHLGHCAEMDIFPFPSARTLPRPQCGQISSREKLYFAICPASLHQESQPWQVYGLR